MKYQYLSEIGIIEVLVQDNLVYGIYLLKDGNVVNHHEEIDNLFDSYFEGRIVKPFPFELADIGTDFQKRVRKELLKVRYGEIMSYGELAKKISDKMSSRAVGHALNKNPFMIVVPCHRIIGSNSKLVGFDGGVENKRILLEDEGHIIENDILIK